MGHHFSHSDVHGSKKRCMLRNILCFNLFNFPRLKPPTYLDKMIELILGLVPLAKPIFRSQFAFLLWRGNQEFLRASFASSVLQCFGRSLWQADSFKCLGLQPGVLVSSRKGLYQLYLRVFGSLGQKTITKIGCELVVIPFWL